MTCHAPLYLLILVLAPVAPPHAGLCWHRFRRVPKGQPDPQEYAAKQAQLRELQRLDDAGIIDLYYLDQAGFSLVPCVPYEWQPVGETLTIPSSHSLSLNVLGIMRLLIVII